MSFIEVPCPGGGGGTEDVNIVSSIPIDVNFDTPVPVTFDTPVDVIVTNQCDCIQDVNIVSSTTLDVNVLTSSSPVILRAKALLIEDADPAWTPAMVAGDLTSVSFTVLSGTANLVDQGGNSLILPAGYATSWLTEDSNTLDGPQSIDAIGGSTVVNWTER